MKKKFILSGVYLLGWLYPLSIIIFNIADYFLAIKEPRGCPFDYNNDTMIAWYFYGLLIGFASFLIYFITVVVKFKVKKIFYLTLLNLPMIFCLITCASTYPVVEKLSLNILFLAVSLSVVAFSLSFLFNSEKK